MRFDLLTLFPGLFESPLKASLLGKAIVRGLFEVHVHNLRNWTTDRHRTVDDVPYGGGPGMVLKPEPVATAIESIQGDNSRRIYFSPRGKPLQQGNLKGYLGYDQVILLCGRYEGVDQRIVDHFIDEEISVGDYILSGGELPALIFIEALTRLIPGVVGKEESLQEESFSSVGAIHSASAAASAKGAELPLLEYPQYTRPEEFRGHRVPSVLLSGDHEKIRQWRLEQSLTETRKRRPDLL